MARKSMLKFELENFTSLDGRKKNVVDRNLIGVRIYGLLSGGNVVLIIVEAVPSPTTSWLWSLTAAFVPWQARKMLRIVLFKDVRI